MRWTPWRLGVSAPDRLTPRRTWPLLVLVGIAVVQHLGKYLVGQRAATGPLAGYWEFPGGKCLPGERPVTAACRECLEETGLKVIPVDLLMHRQFAYPHGDVDLHFWLCRLGPNVVPAAEHQGFRWVTPAELGELHFPEANLPLIKVLASRDPQRG